MQKIINLFTPTADGGFDVTRGAEWVLKGEGIATQLLDGIGCLIKDGKFYKSFTGRKGAKNIPAGLVPVPDIDKNTKERRGWIRISVEMEDRPFREGFRNTWMVWRDQLPDGTYELCGPDINGNPERLEQLILIPHGKKPIEAPRTLEELKDYFAKQAQCAGIVWHHPDGRMVKVRPELFGLKRRV